MVTLENIAATPEVSTLPEQVHPRKLTAGTLKSWPFSIWMFRWNFHLAGRTMSQRPEGPWVKKKNGWGFLGGEQTCGKIILLKISRRDGYMLKYLPKSLWEWEKSSLRGPLWHVTKPHYYIVFSHGWREMAREHRIQGSGATFAIHSSILGSLHWEMEMLRQDLLYQLGW